MSFAQTLILKPCGSLMVVRIFSRSASGVGSGWPGFGACPFCCSVSSPRNQSSGGLVQKSFLFESYDFSPCACAGGLPKLQKHKPSAKSKPVARDSLAVAADRHVIVPPPLVNASSNGRGACPPLFVQPPSLGLSAPDRSPAGTGDIVYAGTILCPRR